jgi:hypothetical protein
VGDADGVKKTGKDVVKHFLGEWDRDRWIG